MNSKKLENTLNKSDKGDDVQLRFRCQANHAGFLCLGMFDVEAEVLEIFCEHYEDVLVKLKTGKFVGVQVKTRASNQEVFTAKDEQILGTVRRFIQLEQEFSVQFAGYQIATNHGFLQTKKDGNNLQYLLELSRTVPGDRTLRAYIKKLGVAVKEDVVLSTLKKISLDSGLPKFDNCESHLTHALSQLQDYKGQRYEVYGRVARELVAEMFRASSLSYDKPIYPRFITNGSLTERESQILEGKRVTRERIKKIFDASMNEGALLTPLTKITVDELPKNLSIMKLKMAKGGVTVENISHISDCVYSLEKEAMVWFNKYGKEKAQDRVNHLDVIVTTEYLAEKDNYKESDNPYGHEMLKGVKSRLKTRHTQESGANNLFGIMYEHLLGMVGVLTDNCKFWWSEKFKVKDGEAA